MIWVDTSNSYRRALEYSIFIEKNRACQIWAIDGWYYIVKDETFLKIYNGEFYSIGEARKMAGWIEANNNVTVD